MSVPSLDIGESLGGRVQNADTTQKDCEWLRRIIAHQSSTIVSVAYTINMMTNVA